MQLSCSYDFIVKLLVYSVNYKTYFDFFLSYGKPASERKTVTRRGRCHESEGNAEVRVRV